MVRDILLLGNPRLYEKCRQVQTYELNELRDVVADLHDTLLDFRCRFGAGRAIAAPQIGVMKRLVYMHIGQPTVFINPVLTDKSSEMITLWDDCMSFPDLLVKVRRHRACTIEFFDFDWKKNRLVLENDLSELLQHETDHLDGVLAVSRALHGQAFALKSQKESISQLPENP